MLDRDRATGAVLLALAGVLAIAVIPAHAAYTVQRVVGGLNQPINMAQAPNDSTSIYVVERADSGNQLGRIRKYNLQTQTFSTFLDLPGSINADGGLLSMTFHPQYGSNGLFYVISNNNGTNGLDEYKVVSGTPQLQRRLLEYQNLNNVFHTMNQAFFRPNGNNNELFVTAGDGGTQADDPGFNKSLIESPDSPYGKLMKVDLSGNFATPANGPSHASVDTVALGLRNPYRASFDRQTGDFFIGDVGFNAAEEVNFIPASHFSNPSPPILDFGWTDREGTIATVSPYAGGPGSPGDIQPILDYAHSGTNPLPHPSPLTGQSITGGYAYRGPAEELQGRYFFSDFVNGNVYSGTFDRNTPVASYNGTNLTGLTNHTAAFEAQIGGGADIRNVTSFGEDNAGNLYIVKFGNGFFPPLGQGEIFRIVPASDTSLSVTINRDNGSVTIGNYTGVSISFSSLTIASASGAIERMALTPITGNYDLAGNDQVDNSNNWSITSASDSHHVFSEASSGDAGALANNSSITFSPGGGWIKSPTEDWHVSVTLPGGTILDALVSYVGNGGQSFDRSDLDFDGTIGAGDWNVFKTHGFASLAGLSAAQSYGRGDLDGDGDNDYDDFQIFKRDFNALNGAGSFEAMAAVPEPGTALLMLLGGIMEGLRRCGGRSKRVT